MYGGGGPEWPIELDPASLLSEETVGADFEFKVESRSLSVIIIF